MKLLNSLSQLILLLSSTALASELHAGEQLNENSFDSLTQDGLWFLELYSPFCPGCKNFAPSWIELVKIMKPYEAQGLSLGQVDCMAQGDLCARLGVPSYPALKLYRDGKVEESYDGEKTVESIQKYLEDQVKAYRSTSEPAHHTAHHAESHHAMPSPETYASDLPTPQASPPPESEDPTLRPLPTIPTDKPIELPNPQGQVIKLHHNNWNSFTDSTKNPFPIFVHFHTAWCKVCRTLTHVWEETAGLLQNQVNVGEFDCEAKRNKEICKREHILQFPSFMLYHEGSSLAYLGPTLPASMADFILRTVATPGTHEVTMHEFDQAIQKKDIFFMFLHSNRTPISTVNSVQAIGKALLGSAVILKSDHQDIYDRLGLSNYNPYLLVFKEYEPNPWAKMELEEMSPNDEPDQTLRHRRMATFIQRWVAVHSIRVLDELDQRNYHRVFNSGAKKIVVLACLSGIVPSPDGIDLDKSNPRSVQLKDEMKSWALQWRKSQEARNVEDLIVDWVWVNSGVWAKWLSDTYAVNLPRPTEDPRDSSIILLIDAQHHRFYDTQSDGRDIEFTPASVFQNLMAVEMGKLSGKTTGTFMSRMAWRFHLFKLSTSFLLEPHWLLLLAVLLAIVGFTLKSHGNTLARGAVGYSPISPQTAKALKRGLSSPESYSSKSPGFGSVFGLASNVPCKAD